MGQLIVTVLIQAAKLLSTAVTRLLFLIWPVCFSKDLSVLQKQPPEVFYTKKACNFIKKDTLAQVLSCEYCKIFKNTFSTEHFWATSPGIRR